MNPYLFFVGISTGQGSNLRRAKRQLWALTTWPFRPVVKIHLNLFNKDFNKHLKQINQFIPSFQTLTMEDIYQNHDPKRKLERDDSSMHFTDYHGSVVEEDRRLPMYGWNIEALNMLVLPMVKSK